MRRALVLIVILLAALTLLACGDDGEPGAATNATSDGAATNATSDGSAATATTTTGAARRRAKDGCEPVALPQPAADPERRRSRKRLSSKLRHTAIVRTNCGTIEIRLAVGRAPKTTSSFAGLARNGFYDNLTFHRIAKPGGNDFVIQGGDPLGTGNGGPGYSVVEAPPKSTRYRRYVVAMAKTQTERPGTSGSQFFIVTADEVPLPPDYALLGTVVDGREVVRRIAALATDPATEMPLDPVVIRSVRIRSTPKS